MILQSLALILGLVFGFLVGAGTLFGYMLWRMMGNDGWDDSNINNAERLLSHVVLHPEDFGKMYYLNDLELEELEEVDKTLFDSLKRPFWYVDKDEFSEVVQTRP